MNAFQICVVCLYIAFLVHSFLISLKPIPTQLQNSFINTTDMVSSSNPKERVKQNVGTGKVVDTRGHLEAWFASDSPTKSSNSIDKHLKEYNKKIINTPKFVRLDWLKENNLLRYVSYWSIKN